MVPGYDVSLLRHASQTLKARAKPVRDKRARYVHPMRLLQLGLDLMEGAEDQPGRRGVRRASRYRDGLIIAFLAAFGPRRRNITVMEIGVHLIKMGDIYAIRLEGHEMKGHRPYEASLPELLTPYIDRYLDDWRRGASKGPREQAPLAFRTCQRPCRDLDLLPGHEAHQGQARRRVKFS